jgi:hypothetical protein
MFSNHHLFLSTTSKTTNRVEHPIFCIYHHLAQPPSHFRRLGILSLSPPAPFPDGRSLQVLAAARRERQSLATEADAGDDEPSAGAHRDQVAIAELQARLALDADANARVWRCARIWCPRIHPWQSANVLNADLPLVV